MRRSADRTRDHSFTLEIGLGALGGRTEDVRAEIADHLDAFPARIHHGPSGQLVLTLTVEAADLWLSILLAMAAVTQIGYAPRTLRARPTADHPPWAMSRRRQSPDQEANECGVAGDVQAGEPASTPA